MEYSGWTLYNEITLVIKSEQHPKYRFPQGYLVNPKDKKQMQGAINWGTAYKYEKIEDQYISRTIEPKIITVKNENIKMELADSAQNSCNGGKVSFWNCIISIENEGIKCVVGINSQLLLKLLVQCDMHNGKVKQQLKFARCSGGVGLLHESMIEYKEALRDMQTKTKYTKGKTSKWQIGCNYKTLTLDEIYLGKMYRPFKVYMDYNYTYSSREYIIEQEKNYEKYIIQKTNNIPENVNSYGQYMDYITNKASKLIYDITEEYKKTERMQCLELYYTIPFMGGYTLNSTPARVQGDRSLILDINVEKSIEDTCSKIKEKLVELLDSGMVYIEPDSLPYLITSTKPIDINKLSDLDKQLIVSTFNNYKIYTMRNNIKVIISNNIKNSNLI